MHLDSFLHCMAGLEATMCIFFDRLTVDDLAVLLLYHALPSYDPKAVSQACQGVGPPLPAAGLAGLGAMCIVPGGAR